MRLNQLIAEKVMGWKVYSTNNAGLVLMDEAMSRDWGPTGVVLATQAELDAKKYIKTTYVPEYSTSIEAAWNVVGEMCREKWWAQMRTPFTEDDHYLCGFTPKGATGWNGRPDHSGFAKTLPLAICIAALKACAVPESEITAAMEAK